jgi:hypothetical protein
MLTFDDEPTIRHAILKRLDKERDVRVCHIPIARSADCITVGILAQIGSGALIVKSRFELPLEFELTQLHNQIDEIAESYKAARMGYWREGRPQHMPERALPGSGLRGGWHG